MIELLLKKDPSFRPTIDEILALDYVAEKLKQLNFNSKFKGLINSNSGNLHNNNDAQMNLFNLGYGNLLRDTNEVVEIQANFSNSPKDNKIQVDRCHIKYSPSYAINDMNEIIKNLNIPLEKKDEEKQCEENLNEGNLSKLSKNQISVPDLNKNTDDSVIYSPEKLSIEESKKEYIIEMQLK